MKFLFGLLLYVKLKSYFLYYALRICSKTIAHNNSPLQDTLELQFTECI